MKKQLIVISSIALLASLGLGGKQNFGVVSAFEETALSESLANHGIKVKMAKEDRGSLVDLSEATADGVAISKVLVQNKMNDDGSQNLRFVAAIHVGEYNAEATSIPVDEIGFNVNYTYNGKDYAYSYPVNTVYSDIKAGEKTYDRDNLGAFGDKGSYDYFMTYALLNIPEAAFDTSITVRPYVKMNDMYHTSALEKTSSVDDLVEKFSATVAIYESDISDNVLSKLVEAGAPMWARVDLKNLPEGKTAADYEYEWPVDGPIFGVGGADKTKRLIYPKQTGVFDLVVKIKDGDTVIAEPSFTFKVTADYTKYTVINTCQDFVDKVLGPTSGADKFMLGANLDLGGARIEGKQPLNAVVDGRGYSVTNFVTATGLWDYVAAGAVRNMHVKGIVDRDEGFIGLFGREMIDNALVEDCLVEAKSTVSMDTWNNDQKNLWKSGAIVGTSNGTIKNCVVVNVDGNPQLVDASAYAGSGKIDNLYTANDAEAADQHVLPTTRGTTNIAGTNTNIHDKMDWATSTVDDYASLSASLHSEYWKLEDGKMPSMIHDGEEAVVFSASLKVNKDKLNLDLDASGEVIATAAHFSGDVTYSATFADEGIASATNEDGVFTVTGIAAGETTMTIKAASGEEELTAVVTIKVTNPNAGPVGTAISTFADFKAIFDGAGTHCNDSFYLANDIDCTGFDKQIGMAGEFKGVFDGNGHTLNNLDIQSRLFNIIGADGVVKNITINGTWSPTGAGTGCLSYSSTGKFDHITMNIELKTAVPGAVGFLEYMGASTMTNNTIDVKFGKDLKMGAFFVNVCEGNPATCSGNTLTFHNHAESETTNRSDVAGSRDGWNVTAGEDWGNAE